MRNAILICFLSTSTLCFGQNAGTFDITPQYTFTDQRSTLGLGVHLGIPIGDSWGLDYNFALGARLDRGLYAHTSGTAQLGGWWLATLGDLGDTWQFIGIMMFAIPEGFNYTIVEDETTAMKIHLVVQGYDYDKHFDVETRDVTWGAAISYRKDIGKNMFLGFEAGSRKFYGFNTWLFDIKAKIGWRLNDTPEIASLTKFFFTSR